MMADGTQVKLSLFRIWSSGTDQAIKHTVCTQNRRRVSNSGMYYPVESRLFQQPIHLDFASGAEIDAPVHHDRDHKTCGQRGTVALAVLFGAIEGLAEFSGIEGVKGRGDVRTVPRFRSDGPDDRVLVAVGGNGRRCAGSLELGSGRTIREEFPVLDRALT